MSFHAISASSLAPLSLAPASTPDAARPSEQPPVDTGANRSLPVRFPGQADQLTLSSDPGSQLAAPTRSLTSLKFKSELKLKPTDDGGVVAKYKSRLKFTYEFQSEDGTTVKLSAKLKSKFSYKQDGDESLEFKARVKFELSATVKTVESSLAPALESDAVNADQNGVISQAIEEFGSIVDTLASQFADGTLFGDDVIVSVVDAFNQLTESVRPQLPTESQTPSGDSLPAGAEAPPAAVETPTTTPAAPPTSSVSTTSVPVSAPSDVQPAVDSSSHDSSASVAIGSPADALVSDLSVTDHSETVDNDSDRHVEEADESHEPDKSDESHESDESDATEPFSGQAILVNLRLNFTQSLTSLISVLDTPVDGGTTSLFQSSFSARLKFELRFADGGESSHLGYAPAELGVDAQA